MSVERIPVTIKPERVNRQVTLMKDRLHGQGLSVGSCCNIPVKCNHFYLPLTKEGASDKLVNLDVIRTMYALKELNDNVMGMIGYAGTFKKTPDTLKGLGIENVNRIDTGIWEHLYELGRNSEPKISEEEIKKDMVEMALDPKARSVHFSKWATEVRCPKWLDKEKSTSIEILAAAYATDNDELQKKIKDNIKSDDDGNKRRASYDVSTGEITQAQFLVSYLREKKIPVKYVDFPQYYKSFHGKTVAKFLRGEFGSMNEISPYLASLAYALDRASIKREMDEFLAAGGVIVANRYATSSMAHQAAKCKTEKEQNEFLKWIYELEYKVHKVPKENLVIYLHVPWKKSLELTQTRGDRAYLKGMKQDIAEKDLEHRKASEEMYLKLAKKHRHWKMVECVEKGKLLSREAIFEHVLQLVKPILS